MDKNLNKKCLNVISKMLGELFKNGFDIKSKLYLEIKELMADLYNLEQIEQKKDNFRENHTILNK